MGCTLRAALDALPARARVRVAELNPVVLRWCGGPLAPLNRKVLADPRVEVCGVDVADLIRAARDSFDAILLDLYEGPHAGTDPVGDPFYGMAALEAARRALVAGGVLGIWSEDPDAAVEGSPQELLRSDRPEVRNFLNDNIEESFVFDFPLPVREYPDGNAPSA